MKKRTAFNIWLVLGSILILGYTNISVSDPSHPLKKIPSLEPWRSNPTLPEHWIEIDRKVLKISKRENSDTFMLASDKETLFLIRFYKDKIFWNLNILGAYKISDFTENKIEIKNLKIKVYADGVMVVDSDPNTKFNDALFIYEWDTKSNSFVGVEFEDN